MPVRPDRSEAPLFGVVRRLYSRAGRGKTAEEAAKDVALPVEGVAPMKTDDQLNTQPANSKDVKT